MILTIGHVILLLAAAAAAASHPPFNHPPPPSVPLSPLQYVFFLYETGMSRVKGSAGSPLLTNYRFMKGGLLCSPSREGK
jgi:hypothetical protein